MPSVSITEMLSVEKCGDSHWHGEDFLSIWLCFSSRPYSNGNERDRFTPSVSACVFDAFVSSQGDETECGEFSGFSIDDSV